MDLCLVGFGFTLLFLDLLIRLALCCQRQQLARSLPCQKLDEKAERERWRAFLEFHTGERAGQYTSCKIDSNNNVFTGENNPIVFCRPLPSLPSCTIVAGRHTRARGGPDPAARVHGAWAEEPWITKAAAAKLLSEWV